MKRGTVPEIRNDPVNDPVAASRTSRPWPRRSSPSIASIVGTIASAMTRVGLHVGVDLVVGRGVDRAVGCDIVLARVEEDDVPAVGEPGEHPVDNVLLLGAGLVAVPDGKTPSRRIFVCGGHRPDRLDDRLDAGERLAGRLEVGNDVVQADRRRRPPWPETVELALEFEPVGGPTSGRRTRRNPRRSAARSGLPRSDLHVAEVIGDRIAEEGDVGLHHGILGRVEL